jgi:hypothetical protein
METILLNIILHTTTKRCNHNIYTKPMLPVTIQIIMSHWLDDDDADDANSYYAFTVTSTPAVSFSSTIQIQTFNPKCTTLQPSPDLCEGVLIPDSQDSPKSPGLGTQQQRAIALQDPTEPLPLAMRLSASLSSF